MGEHVPILRNFHSTVHYRAKIPVAKWFSSCSAHFTSTRATTTRQIMARWNICKWSCHHEAPQSIYLEKGIVGTVPCRSVKRARKHERQKFWSTSYCSQFEHHTSMCFVRPFSFPGAETQLHPRRTVQSPIKPVHPNATQNHPHVTHLGHEWLFPVAPASSLPVLKNIHSITSQYSSGTPT